MSVINKMLRDLDQRAEAQGKPEPSLRGAGIPFDEAAGEGRRWKLAALALSIPLAVAIGWILWQPRSETSNAPARPAPAAPLAQVTPAPAEVPKKPAEPELVPTPKPAAVASSSQPPVPDAAAPKPAIAPTIPPPAVAPPAIAPTIPPQAAAIAAPPSATAPSPDPKPKPEPVPTPKQAAVASSSQPPLPDTVAPKPPIAPAIPPQAAAIVAPPSATAPSPDPKPKPAPEPALPPQAPSVAAPSPAAAPAPAKALPIAEASVAPAKPAPKSEIPARERKQDQKRDQRAELAISIAKKPAPPSQAVQQPEKAPPKTPAPAPSDAPSGAVATAGGAAGPDTAKGNISVTRQGQGSSRLERVSSEYRNAVDLMNQGRVEPAIAAFSDVLRADARHAPARQSLVALLISRGRGPEAQGVLREGLAVLPENAAWSMLLARLQIEGGDAAGALATLDGALPYARNRPDYHTFVGTLLQMQGRHKEAIAHYEIAVRLAPESGRSLTGLAMSLEEERRTSEARDAYARALATNTLGPDLQAFVERKLSQLR
jgi:MSHA biogenesis protein MshN